MDMHVLMADRRLLQCIAGDLLSDIRSVKNDTCTTLVGNKVITCAVDFDKLEKSLEATSTCDETPLWQLQYTLCVCAFVSDSVVTFLANVVDNKQMKYWFDGHKTLADFRSRFEMHLVGKFSNKAKKGSRKHVVVDATTPQMHAVSDTPGHIEVLPENVTTVYIDLECAHCARLDAVIDGRTVDEVSFNVEYVPSTDIHVKAPFPHTFRKNRHTHVAELASDPVVNMFTRMAGMVPDDKVKDDAVAEKQIAQIHTNEVVPSAPPPPYEP